MTRICFPKAASLRDAALFVLLPIVRGSHRRFITILLFVAEIGGGDASELKPYEVDEATLHLWHLDEESPPFLDAGPANVPLLGLLNGAEAGLPGLPNLGRAVSLHHNIGGEPGISSLRGGILIPAAALDSGPADNAPPELKYMGDDGAFTYEALVKLDQLPQDAQVIALTILSIDGEANDRLFNFRIERQGFLAFTPLPSSGAAGGALAQIPRSGPHAVNTEDWFHVAVTYDGRAGVPDNTRLYWTRVAEESDHAHRIGSGSLSADISGNTGDFAIGNEARSMIAGNAEAEPFPGLIDEVRISSIARHPADFILTDQKSRPTPSNVESPEATGMDDRLELKLAGLLVDGAPTPFSGANTKRISIPPGLHRLDFDITFPQNRLSRPVELRCQLDGFDGRWLETARGMGLVVQILDANGKAISEVLFNAIGSSTGWSNRLSESELTPRSEPIFLPLNAESLRIILDSGPPDTTGSLAIDDIAIHMPGIRDPIWAVSFNEGINLTSPAGVPNGWQRGGNNPAIAQILVNPSSPALALVDGDQSQSGTWSTKIPLPSDSLRGKTVMVRWIEAHTVIGGGQHRATYLNVPPGEYVFRSLGLVENSEEQHVSLSVPLEIRPRVWDRAWFWPFFTASGMSMFTMMLVRRSRRRARRRVRELEFQHALERDRTRIARDLHDDLGTRVTLLNFSASLAQQELERAPEKARRHLGKLSSTARDLVVAMDDLVWAVDPAHDTVEHLASHITRLAEEIFRDSPILCRLDIPAELPDCTIGSDFRHHLALAVKEALHNVLRHSNAGEVLLSLKIEASDLVVEIKDDGEGFDSTTQSGGHGLENFHSRLAETGGTCQIDSSPGDGTRITLQSPLSNPLDKIQR